MAHRAFLGSSDEDWNAGLASLTSSTLSSAVPSIDGPVEHISRISLPSGQDLYAF
jgi:hypothetical protein